MRLTLCVGNQPGELEIHALQALLLRSGVECSVEFNFSYENPSHAINSPQAESAPRIIYQQSQPLIDQQISREVMILAHQGLYNQKETWLSKTTELLKYLQISEPKSWREVHRSLFQHPNAAARFDLPACCYGLMQRWEEDLTSHRDEHNRWTPSDSILTKTGFLEIPIVDWIARSLGEELHRRFQLPLSPTPLLLGALSWDVDSAGFWRFPHLAGKVKRTLSQKNATPVSLMKSLAQTLQNPRLDPDRPFAEIAKKLYSNNSRSTMFVQTHRANRWDNYDLLTAHWLVRQLRDFSQCGHEIALHSSYGTPKKHPSFMQEQSAVLGKYLGTELPGHRAHYLCHSTTEHDLKRWKHAAYDATMGYSQRIGFRLGTAWPVILRRGMLATLEFPLNAMDVTLRHHQFAAQKPAASAVHKLIDSIRETGGIFSLLWHPHNLNQINGWHEWKEFPFTLIKESGIPRWVCLNEAQIDVEERMKRLFDCSI